MVIGHQGNQISCRGRETFVGSSLALQWVPGSGKAVRGDTKMSPGRVSPGVLQKGSGSKHKQMSQKVLKHFERCFTYALAQNKGNSENVKAAVLSIVPH